MARIPQVLHEHINTAYPANVCLVGTVLPNGFAQITPRGSTMVFDDEHIALWERGKGTTTENLTDGTPGELFSDGSYLPPFELFAPSPKGSRPAQPGTISRLKTKICDLVYFPAQN